MKQAKKTAAATPPQLFPTTETAPIGVPPTPQQPPLINQPPSSQPPGVKPPRVHGGTYTISHPEQGHFTLKLHTAQKGDLAGKRILSLLVGPDNVNNYQGCAFWDDEAGVANVWKRFKGAGSRMPIDGYSWQDRGWSATEAKLAIWADLAMRGDGTGGEQGEDVDEDGKPRRGFWGSEGYRLLLEGRCCVCNRKLTTPESIRLGIGPKCGGRI